MPTPAENPAPLPAARLTELLQPYLPDAPTSLTPEIIAQLQVYLGLLLRWNARTNLTSVRDPESIVTRHFGESLFAACILSRLLPQRSSLLDFGSGAGFPGLPIQLYRPDLQVTLAESQNKKATFLREVVRTLNLPTAVHAARVENLPPTTTFDCIALRAVDDMQAATSTAVRTLGPAGWLALMTTSEQDTPDGALLVSHHPIPRTLHTELSIYRITQ